MKQLIFFLTLCLVMLPGCKSNDPDLKPLVQSELNNNIVEQNIDKRYFVYNEYDSKKDLDAYDERPDDSDDMQKYYPMLTGGAGYRFMSFAFPNCSQFMTLYGINAKLVEVCQMGTILTLTDVKDHKAYAENEKTWPLKLYSVRVYPNSSDKDSYEEFSLVKGNLEAQTAIKFTANVDATYSVEFLPNTNTTAREIEIGLCHEYATVEQLTSYPGPRPFYGNFIQYGTKRQ